MAVDTAEEPVEDWGKGERNERDCDCGEDGPKEEGMPLP